MKSRFSPPVVEAASAPASCKAMFGRARRGFERLELGMRRPPPSAPPPTAPTREELEQQAHEAALTAGHDEGYRAGFDEGLEDARRQWAERLGRIDRAIEDIGRLRAVLSESYRHEAVELAIGVAEALAQAVLTDDARGRVHHLIERGLALLGRDDPITVRVHPDARPGLGETMSEAQRDGFELSIIEDPRLAPFDVRIESPLATVESSMLDRVHHIRQLVLGERTTLTDSPEGPK